MCTSKEVRHPLSRIPLALHPPTLSFFSRAQCPWPLDAADDIDQFCLPAADPLVTRSLSATHVDISQPQPPAATAQDSSASDELQHISNMLFQPSPACSPSMHGVGVWRLPSGDSLPPSTMLGPSGAAMMPLPPAFELGAAVEATTDRLQPQLELQPPRALGQASGDLPLEPASPVRPSPMPPPEPRPSPAAAPDSSRPTASAAAASAAVAAQQSASCLLPSTVPGAPVSRVGRGRSLADLLTGSGTGARRGRGSGPGRGLGL